MKRLGLITAILAVIIAAESAGLAWTGNYTSELAAGLDALSRQERTEILPGLENILAEWDDRRQLLSLFLQERPLDDFERTLHEAKERFLLGEAEAELLLLMAADAAARIWETERPTLQNIF